MPRPCCSMAPKHAAAGGVEHLDTQPDRRAGGKRGCAALRSRSARACAAPPGTRFPRDGSSLDTVPEPSKVPAVNPRVRAMCADGDRRTRNAFSPASQCPTSVPLSQTCSGRCTRPAAPGGTELVGRDRERRGTRWPASPERTRSPLAISPGEPVLRRVTSLARQSNRNARGAAAPRRAGAEAGRRLAPHRPRPRKSSPQFRRAPPVPGSTGPSSRPEPALVDEWVGRETGRRLVGREPAAHQAKRG